MKTALTTASLAILFFFSIYLIAQYISDLPLIEHSGTMLLCFTIPAIIGAGIAYYFLNRSVSKFDTFRYTGITLIFLLVIFEGFGLWVNNITSTNCQKERVFVEGYKGMFVSGYGRMQSENVANKWELRLLTQENQILTYTLDKDIFSDIETLEKGQEISINFCTSIFGVKKLSL